MITATVRRLFRELGVTYIRRTRVRAKAYRAPAQYDHEYYRENRLEFRRLEKRYGAFIRAAAIAPVVINDAGRDFGRGLFAAADLRSGTFVGEYAGIVQTNRDGDAIRAPEGGYLTDYSFDYLVNLDDGTPLELNARRHGNEMRFANHSEKPNLEVEHTLIDGVWTIFLVARRKIREGEQLFYHYGDDYWSDGHRTMRL
jgi:SET domain-containing protein